MNKQTTCKEDNGQTVKQSDRKNTVSDVVKDNKPTLSEEDMLNMRKKIRNLSVKKTFDTLSQLGVKKKIELFSDKSQEVKCVVGRGYCAGHNVKLVPNIETSKVSHVDCNGRVTLPMREVTTLTCPARKPLVGNMSAILVMLSEEPELGTTNGKKNKLGLSCAKLNKA